MHTGSIPIRSFLSDNSNYLRYLLGVACKILSLSCFCIISLAFEHNKADAPSSIAQYGIVCAIGTLILAPIILCFFRKELLACNFKLYPIRAIFSLIATVCWFEAIKLLGSSKAMLVTYLGPILVIAIASATGVERLQKKCLFAGLFCYLSIFFALNLDPSMNGKGFVLAAVSAVFWALYEITCKKQTQTEHCLIQVFGTLFVTTLLLLPFFYGDCSNITFNVFSEYFAIAILRICNCLFLFLAIKYATLNWIVPVSYTKFVIMVFWGYIFNGAVVEQKYFVACILLILLNTVIMHYRSHEQVIKA